MDQIMAMFAPHQFAKQPHLENKEDVVLPPIKSLTGIRESIPGAPGMLQSNNNYFYGNRPPSARSNAISEIDLNSDVQSMNSKGFAMGTGQIRKNNLMMSGHDLVERDCMRQIGMASTHLEA